MSEAGQEDPPRKKGGIVKLLASILFVLILLAGGVLAGGYYMVQEKLAAPGPLTVDGADRVVTIPNGVGVIRIGSVLQESGAIEDSRFFRIAAKLEEAETSMKAGEYAIPSGASLKEIIAILEDGKSILYPVTIPEGLTSAAILKIISEAPVLTGDVPTEIAEGAMLPDTYMVQRGEDRGALVQRMIKARETVMEALWAERQPGLPVKTKEEALILASIVEKETGLAEERPQVASVFTNRLRRNMRLETDPTIIYGVCMLHPDRCVDGRLVDRNGKQRGIRQSELRMETGYNTYKIPRLPPTPICNPGKEAIAAVLNPPQTKYIFFVADGTGGHAFAVTHAEHLRNVANWRRIEKSRQ